MNIALFGTSADPPTAAHQHILQWLAAHYDQVLVWASDNPFKAHQTSLTHRMVMLERLIGSLPNPNLQVCEELSDRRSLVSLQRAKTLWGENQTYYLVIGSDLVSQIPKWYQVDTLLKSVILLIFRRSGYALQEKGLQKLTELGGHYQIIDIEIPGVSSTDYRLHQDQTILPLSIQDYIQQENLYL